MNNINVVKHFSDLVQLVSYNFEETKMIKKALRYSIGFFTLHDDEPIVNNSELKQGNTGHENVVKVIEIIVILVDGSIVRMIVLLHSAITVIKK